MSVRRKILLSALVAVSLLICAAVAAGVFVSRALEKERAKTQAQARAVDANPQALEASWKNLSFDPRDRRALKKNSEEVFVGKVMRLKGHGNNEPTPFLEGWTPTARFAVKVEKVEKDASSGDGLKVGGTVTVDQLGVPLPGTKATVCFGDGYPRGGYVPAQKLRVGLRYVFAAEYDARHRWHEVRVDPFGWMVLSRDAPPDGAPEAGDGQPSCNHAAEMRRG